MVQTAFFDARRLRHVVRPLSGTPSDFDEVIAASQNARYVLIGQATHGTHEFYKIRAEITKRLIRDHGFAAVAIEGDWPDAHRVHNYVVGRTADADATDALGGFRRFPTWMWRNADVLDFIGWLRSFNDARPANRRAGFFGLDLYSLYASIEAVVTYLEGVDPAAAERAKERYGCFDRFGGDVERYARSVGTGMSSSCRREVAAQLIEMQRAAFERVARQGSEVGDEQRFFAEQNAFVVARAEQYYRAMLDADVSSWNLRDGFMYETLGRLTNHLERSRSNPARVVIWAHNSHVGDARATTMGAGREFNIGQLVRQHHRSECYTIGFTTSEGTVTAASQWHGEPERKAVRPPVTGSWEALFHAVGIPNFALDLRKTAAREPALHVTLLERAIGVLYLPQTELHSHYFQARITGQFDTVFHFDRTRAVEPLERNVVWESGEVPETYPTGV
jgi:erythromycin esterase-like protein